MSSLSFFKVFFALMLLAGSLEQGNSFQRIKSIVNGHIGDWRQFPFIAMMRVPETPGNYSGPYKTYCGATIVNEYWAVTAAHCVLKGKADSTQTWDNMALSVGVNSIHDDPNAQSRTYPVSRIIPFMNYKAPPGNPYGDLALLQLAKPIQFVDGITSACLDYSEQIYDYMYIAGYGGESIRWLGWTDGPSSGWETVYPEKQGNLLKYALVREKRNATFCDKGMVNVCVVPAENQYDSGCFGDSGSPVITPDFRSILGVLNYLEPTYDHVSSLYAYCFNGMAFTRLSQFRDFIDFYIGVKNYCKIE